MKIVNQNAPDGVSGREVHLSTRELFVISDHVNEVSEITQLHKNADNMNAKAHIMAANHGKVYRLLNESYAVLKKVAEGISSQQETKRDLFNR